MIEETYSNLSRSIHRRYFGKRAPVEVSIELTRRCPLDCLHCYNNLPMNDAAARAQELTLEEHCRLLDELVEAGCLWITYTGGEIFARRDFLDIYTAAKKRGFLITLFTNGTMITPRVADYLAEWRPFAIEITLYGASKETYEALTQVPGSFAKCMNAIRMLLDRRLPLKLKTVPTSVNKHEVYEMKRLAEEEFHVEFKFDPLVNPRIDCSQSPLAVRLSTEEVVALDYFDPKRKREYRRLIDDEQLASKAENPDSKQRYFCGGGMSGCAIDPAGEMSICVISHQQTYNIRSGGFHQGWNGRLQEIRRQERTRETICDRCQIRSICGMCAANGELENGDPESPVEFLCQVAHLRTYALGLTVPEHGDCPCCKPGKLNADLMESARRIQAFRPDPSRWESAKVALPVLNVLQQSAPPRSGACSSCSVHRS